MKNPSWKLDYPWRWALFLAAFCWASVEAPVSAQEPQDDLDINSAAVNSAGEELGLTKQEGTLAEIFRLEKELVYQLLDKLGIGIAVLTPGIKAQIDSYHTTNLEAFLAYSECIDLFDQERFSEAREACERAVRLDPEFRLAIALLQSIPPDGWSGSVDNLASRLIEIAQATVAGGAPAGFFGLFLGTTPLGSPAAGPGSPSGSAGGGGINSPSR